jgi:hypothetical protein
MQVNVSYSILGQRTFKTDERFQSMVKVYRSGYAVEYTRYTGAGRRESEKYDRNNNLSQVGRPLSKEAKKRITQLCHYFYQSKKRFYWVTFTIPRSRHAIDTGEFKVVYDNELKRWRKQKVWREYFLPDKFYIQQFSKLLENFRRNYNLKGYFWVAERQKERGAIHFHAVFQCHFLKYAALERNWRRLLSEYHLTNQKKYSVKPLRINNIRTLKSYITKYATKNDAEIYGASSGFTHNYVRLYREKCQLELFYDEFYYYCEAFGRDFVERRDYLNINDFEVTMVYLRYNLINSFFASCLN